MESLERERPDLHERVEAKDLFANAAAIEAAHLGMDLFCHR
jgi:hypothetical protein